MPCWAIFGKVYFTVENCIHEAATFQTFPWKQQTSGEPFWFTKLQNNIPAKQPNGSCEVWFKGLWEYPANRGKSLISADYIRLTENLNKVKKEKKYHWSKKRTNKIENTEDANTISNLVFLLSPHAKSISVANRFRPLQVLLICFLARHCLCRRQRHAQCCGSVCDQKADALDKKLGNKLTRCCSPVGLWFKLCRCCQICNHLCWLFFISFF